MSHKLLVLCTGNHCRSPMAEAMALDLADAWKLDLEVRSAGTQALVGQQAAEDARTAIKEWGLDLESHRGQQLELEHMEWADRVLVMERAHRFLIERLYPDLAHKVVEAVPDRGVTDPINKGLGAYRVCRDHLGELMPELFRSFGWKKRLLAWPRPKKS